VLGILSCIFLFYSFKMVSAFDVTFGLGGLTVVYLLFTLTKKKNNSPPGPKGYPIIGNLFDMPSGGEVHVWGTWREQWGEIIFMLCYIRCAY
jgi:hypothetical protein